MILTLPYPPSVNRMWRTPNAGPLAGRTMLSSDGRRYRADVAMVVAAYRQSARSGAISGRHWPVECRLSVDIEARMPDRRKRDIDNLPKAVLDALTHTGVWADDSQIDDLRVWRSPEMGGVVIVTIAQRE